MDVSNDMDFYKPNVAPTHARHRRARQIRMPPSMIKLTDDSCSEILGYEDVEVDEEILEGVATTDVNGIKEYTKMRIGLKIFAHMILLWLDFWKKEVLFYFFKCSPLF